MRRRTTALLVSLVTLIPSCIGSDASTDVPPFTAIDSSGVRIAVNAAPLWTEVTAWTLDREPDLVIGSVSGEGGTDFRRIQSVVRLSDGSIVLVDAAQTVRRFDSTGAFMGMIGGRGQGPGEFMGIGNIARYRGDSLAFSDVVNQRAQYYSADGSHARSVRLEPRADDPPRNTIRGFFADGSIASVELGSPQDLPPGGGATPMTFWAYDSQGGFLGGIGAGSGFRYTAPSSQAQIRLSSLTRSAVAGMTLWLTEPDKFEIRGLAPDGTLRMIVRRTVEAEPVPAELAAAEQAEFEADLEPQRAGGPPQRTFAIAETIPLMDGFLVSHDGHLWVKAAATADELLARQGDPELPASPQRWSVFSPEGRWLGEVSVPQTLEVEEVGPDYILAVRQDELGVQYVQVHSVIKP